MSSGPPSPTNPRILLRVSNQKAYVWDVDDIATLRRKYRICGLLTGTLPHLAQQNIFLGVPLILMPEEVVLLMDKELAVLADDGPSHHPATQAQLLAYRDAQVDSARRQITQAEAKEAAAAARVATSPAAVQKRKEREEKRKRAAALKTQVDTGAADDPNAAEGASNTDKSLAMNTESQKPKKGEGLRQPAGEEPLDTSVPPLVDSKHPYTIAIPASSTSLDWYDVTGNVYTSIALAKEAGIWNYPASLHERAQCGVFRALWERGFYLGGGLRFGGDYLVYPDDPLRYHSHFVASVIDSPTSAISPMQIVAHGRLGTGTKKSHLLCGWDDGKQEVTFFSIEWAGFG